MGILQSTSIGGRMARHIVLVLVGFLGARLYVHAHAQEVEPTTAPVPGLVLVNGTWQVPSPLAALRKLMVPHEPGRPASAPAIAVLRQQFEPRSRTELDAFADELLRVMQEGSEDQRRDAAIVLLASARMEAKDGAWLADPGEPYRGAANVFRRLFESYDDPLSGEAQTALANLLDTGGVGYVRALFEASEPPACRLQHEIRSGGLGENRCMRSPSMWCQAGKLLLYGAGPQAGAPDRVRYRRLCEGASPASEPSHCHGLHS